MDVRLVQFSERHLSAFEAMLVDPDVKRFTRLPVPTPPGFPRTWLERYEQGRRDGTSEAFAIVGDADGFLGCGMAFGIEADEGKAELGYIVAPAARGRGVAVAMLAELTRWAFAELEALRITLIIDVENAPSSRVAERCGYVREGVMRSTHLKDDVRVDAAIWSRLPLDP
jgi:RimJ/RimL family protein N-acetyltransferase